jgi:hypothetical protein
VILTGAQLSLLLDQGLAATPDTYPVELKSLLRATVTSDDFLASTDSAETKALATAMAPYHHLISSAALMRLEGVAVMSVALPLCNVEATLFDGAECILVYDGLLDAVVANVAMSHAAEQLPAIFSSTFPRPDYPDVSAAGWVSVIFGALINRFLTHGEALPDFRLLTAPPDRTSELEHALVGTAWWLMLHELGHLAMGHLSRDAAGPRLANSADMVVTEDLTHFQLQELEADAYAYRCLTDSGKRLAYGWANNALSPSMMLEALQSGHANSHPLSVNRLERARAMASGSDSVLLDLQTRERLLKHGAARASIQKGHAEIRAKGDTPMFSTWPRRDLLTALAGLEALFTAGGLDLEAFLASEDFSWRSPFRSD